MFGAHILQYRLKCTRGKSSLKKKKKRIIHPTNNAKQQQQQQQQRRRSVGSVAHSFSDISVRERKLNFCKRNK
jgi:hypothetical protein